MKKKKTLKNIYICLIVTLIFLLILSLIGVTYAWFSAIVSGNDNAKENVVENATLSIKYTNGEELKGENIVPGWSETKSFSVENTGTANVTYSIIWANLLNEFINKEDLVYTLTSNNNGGTLTETQLPESGENINILENITIEPNVIHTYTLTVTYKNQDKDQTSDTGKKLLGKIEVSDSKLKRVKATKEIISKYSESNTEGLIKINQPATVQMKANTEYRYSGSNNNVKNYVLFNDEVWRIIGVFEVDNGSGTYDQRVKIIRNNTIGNYSWDSSAKGINDFVYNNQTIYGGGTNQWDATKTNDGYDYEGAHLRHLLNPGYTDFSNINNSLYWNRKSGTCYSGYTMATVACDFTSTGLKEEAKKMISDAKWYTGAGYNIRYASETYIFERGNETYNATATGSAIRTTNWVGKVGLMYASDYAYAAPCYKTKRLYEYNGDDIRTCSDNNWLYTSDILKWTLTPYVGSGREVRIVDNSYNGANGSVAQWAASSHSGAVYPSIYLSSNVNIIGGTGTSSDPYLLSL